MLITVLHVLIHESIEVILYVECGYKNLEFIVVSPAFLLNTCIVYGSMATKCVFNLWLSGYATVNKL